MKVGLRTPSLKKSIKARTTGKYKRRLKRMVNPLYGRKGMGWIKNPSRALKNKIYHKTTFSATSAIKGTSGFLAILFYYCIVCPIKWIFIVMFMLFYWMFVAVFYMVKYIVIGLVWCFVALYNAVVSIAEKIINVNRENPIE